MATLYKKMAGTSAVFINSEYPRACPVERDGLIWSASELHLETLPEKVQNKPSLQNVIALEGLEDYDPAQHGDCREVTSLGEKFVYLAAIKGWVQICPDLSLELC